MTESLNSLLAILVALGLLATPAESQGNRQGGGNAFGLDKGRGPPPRDALIVEFVETEVFYEVDDLTGPPGFDATTGTAQFLVAADMPYVVTARFPTWQPGPPAPADYLQPAFWNGSHHIGGRLFLEITERGGLTGGNQPGPPDWVGSGGRPAWVGDPGRPDWVDYQGRRWGAGGRGRPGETGRIYQTSEGRIVVDGGARQGFFELGADLAPLFTDTISGLPEPGTYSLDVEITIQPR